MSKKKQSKTKPSKPSKPDLLQQAASVRERYQQQLAQAHGQPDADAGWAGVGTSAAGALRAQAVAELNELRSQYRHQLGNKWLKLSPATGSTSACSSAPRVSRAWSWRRARDA